MVQLTDDTMGYLCFVCGYKKYPKTDKNKMDGITIMFGDCPVCGKKEVALVPIRDFEYASGVPGRMWD